jgi:hypothetical protein
MPKNIIILLDGIHPEARGFVCAVKRARVIGQRIGGQHQGQRTQILRERRPKT